MNKRERFAVGGAAVLILGLLVNQLFVLPVLDKQELLQRQILSKQEALSQVIQLKREYDEILSQSENLRNIYSKREKNFTLFAFLEKLAVTAGVDKRIDYMKPSSSIDKQTDIELSQVEMKLKEIKLSELMSYLHLVETSQNVVTVKRLSISKDGKNKNISAVLHVETIKS